LAKKHDQGQEEHQRPTYQKMMTTMTMINTTTQRKSTWLRLEKTPTKRHDQSHKKH
jgi:hypothetical protein